MLYTRISYTEIRPVAHSSSFCLGGRFYTWTKPSVRSLAFRGLAHLYVRCEGGNDEVGSHGWKIGTQAAFVPLFSKPAKVGQPRSHAKKGKVKIPTLTSQNQSEIGIGLFPATLGWRTRAMM